MRRIELWRRGLVCRGDLEDFGVLDFAVFGVLSWLFLHGFETGGAAHIVADAVVIDVGIGFGVVLDGEIHDGAVEAFFFRVVRELLGVFVEGGFVVGTGEVVADAVVVAGGAGAAHVDLLSGDGVEVELGDGLFVFDGGFDMFGGGLFERIETAFTTEADAHSGIFDKKVAPSLVVVVDGAGQGGGLVLCEQDGRNEGCEHGLYGLRLSILTHQRSECVGFLFGRPWNGRVWG